MPEIPSIVVDGGVPDRIEALCLKHPTRTLDPSGNSPTVGNWMNRVLQKRMNLLHNAKVLGMAHCQNERKVQPARLAVESVF